MTQRTLPTHEEDTAPPREVKLAALLLLALPVLGLVSSAAGFLALEVAAENAPRLERELAGRVADPQKLVADLLALLRADLLRRVVMSGLQVVVIVVLVRFLLRGSRTARNLVLGLSVLAMLGTLGVPTLYAIRDSFVQRSDGAVITEAALLPGWHLVVMYAALALSLAIAVGLVWLLTRSTANAFFARAGKTEHASPKMPLRRRLTARWGLVATTVLACILVVAASIDDWFWVMHFVAPIDSFERSYGVADMGPAPVAFVIGVVLLVGLVATGIVRTGRAATTTAYVALGLTLLLALDLLLVAGATAELRTAAAHQSLSLRQAYPDASFVNFLASSPASQSGTSALILLGIAAAQAPRPDLGPWIQAGAGGALVLVSMVLPIATAYTAEQPDGTDLWVWSLGGTGMLRGLVAIVLVCLAGGLLLRAHTGQARQWALLALAVLSVVLTVAGTPRGLNLEDVVAGRLGVEPLGVHEGAAPLLQASGGLLICLALVRTWWRARKGT